MNRSMSDHTRHVFVVAILILGVALRILGLSHDLWLDEIWSLSLVSSMSKVSEVIWGINSDNNHILNSLFIYALGPDRAAPWYRSLAFLSSLVSLLGLAYLSRQQNKREGVLSLLLYSFSAFFVVYDSEARGYATATACMIITYLLIARLHQRPSLLNGLGLFTVVSIGVAAHFSFIPFYGCVLIWSSLAALQRFSWKSASASLGIIGAHIAPALLAFIVYYGYVRFIPRGTGPLVGYADVILDALSVPFGGPQLSAVNPERGILTLLIGAIILGIFVAEIRRLAREKKDESIFFVCVIFVMPAIVLLVSEPRVLFIRYFLPAILFGYLLLARACARWFAQGGAFRWGALLALATFMLGNGLNLLDFIRYGRGQYSAAVRYMVTESSAPTVLIASDQDFRNEMVISYHARRLGLEKRIEYKKKDEAATQAIEWYLTHDQSHDAAPPATINGPGNSTFELTKVYPYALLSGWNWFIYRRTDRAEVALPSSSR